MDKVSGRLTVLFEKPFWVGVFEREEQGKLSACKITFGAEPKDFEVLQFICKHYEKLVFSPPVTAQKKHSVKNPKRLQRVIQQQSLHDSIGTKSQQALQLQREQRKLERRTVSRQQREQEKQDRFVRRQQKRKQKHRGK